MVLAGAKLLNRSLLMFREAPGPSGMRSAGTDGLVFVMQLECEVFEMLPTKFSNIVLVSYS